MMLVMARLVRPRRRVTAHWHSFLEPGRGVNGLLFAIYQWLALRLVRELSAVVTTSPVLAQELQRCGCSPHRVSVLPCCLSAEQEHAALGLQRRQRRVGSPLQVLFIGRLDSYKRLDWLLRALAMVQASWHLVVVGEGPRRSMFEALSVNLFGQQASDRVSFLGRLSEADKLAQLDAANLWFCHLTAAMKRSVSCNWRRWLQVFLPWHFVALGLAWVGLVGCQVLIGLKLRMRCQMCCSAWLMTLPFVCDLASMPASVT